MNLLGIIGGQEILIILVIVLVLFGGRKIPELMKGMGKGVRSFKEGMDEVKSEMEKPLEDAVKDAEKNDTDTKDNGK